jgi:hypothetical protein
MAVRTFRVDGAVVDLEERVLGEQRGNFVTGTRRVMRFVVYSAAQVTRIEMRRAR